MEIKMQSKIDYSYLRKQYIFENDNSDINGEINKFLEKNFKESLYEKQNSYQAFFKKLTSIETTGIDDSIDDFFSKIFQELGNTNHKVSYYL